MDLILKIVVLGIINGQLPEKKRNNRTFKSNYIDLIPQNYLEILSNKINKNEDLLSKLEKKKESKKFYKILEFKVFLKNLKNFIKKIFKLIY